MRFLLCDRRTSMLLQDGQYLSIIQCNKCRALRSIDLVSVLPLSCILRGSRIPTGPIQFYMAQ